MSEQEQRFVDLWKRRSTLTKTEWAELYRIVEATLCRYSPAELRELPEEPQYYIQDFFLRKIFEPARHDSSPPVGLGALCNPYYINFLRDQFKRPHFHHEDGSGEAMEASERQAAQENMDECGCKALRELNVAEEHLEQSAVALLGSLSVYDQAYLALNTCVDTPLPISDIAKRFRIPSYHRRAAMLGITRKKGEFVKTYAQTVLGKWLSGLGIDATDSNRSAILRAFDVLCAHVARLKLVPPLPQPASDGVSP